MRVDGTTRRLITRKVILPGSHDQADAFPAMKTMVTAIEAEVITDLSDAVQDGGREDV